MAVSAQPIPAGMEGLIPHLIYDNCKAAIEFYKQAFGAEEVACMPGPDGRVMHAEIRINGSYVFMADDFPEYCGGKSMTPKALGGVPFSVHQYVTDCDAVIDRAVQAGATVKMPAADMFWGDRYGMITDPFGFDWSIATHKLDQSPEETKQKMDAAFQHPPA